jgi:peptidoglycan hydrolase-like protein with peptidoglycan-binding domain
MIGPIYKQTLVQGSAGRLVQLVQEKLAEFGIYTGNIDGKFGADTEEAILLLQKSNSLLVTGQVRQAELDFLGINP